MGPCERGQREQSPGRAVPGPSRARAGLRERPGHCGQLDTAPGTESRPTERSGHRRESLAVTASLKCHSGAFAGTAPVPEPRGPVRASTAGKGLPRPPGNSTRPGQGRTEPAIPEQTLLFAARSLSKVPPPGQGWLQAVPSSSETPALPRGGCERLGTRACPRFAFSESFHSLFPGSSSCDFLSCCQTSPLQPLPPSFPFIPMDSGGVGISDSTKEFWADPPPVGDPMGDPEPLPGARRGTITHLPPEGPE